MQAIDYDNRIFKSIKNSENGDINELTRFYYHHKGTIIWAEYVGGDVLRGQLLALQLNNGKLEVNYHHINTKHEFKTGQCLSEPEILPDGRIRLHENWKWTSGDHSSGQSIIEEIPG